MQLHECAGRSVRVDVGMDSSFTVSYDIIRGGVPLSLMSIENNGLHVRASFGERETEVAPAAPLAVIEDTFREMAGIVEVSRRWTLIDRRGRWIFPVRFTLPLEAGALIRVPAVMYRGNSVGVGAFPRGGGDQVWSFLETRTPLPACVELIDRRRSFICCTEAAKETRFLSSAAGRISGGTGSVTILVPGSERPASYTGKRTITHSSDPAPELSFNGESTSLVIERKFYGAVIEGEGRSDFAAYHAFLAGRAELEEPASRAQPTLSWQQYAELKRAHLLSLVEPGPRLGTAYLKMGRNNGDHQPVYEYTAGSFLVKSIEGALILARDAALPPAVGETPLSEIAEHIGRFFLGGELAPGVHQDCFDLNRGIWGGYLGISEDDSYRFLVNARCNGEVMKSYVHLYEELSAQGRTVKEFLELPERVAGFYLSCQARGEQSGSFGRWWTTRGEPVNERGTNGAYVVSFLITLEPHLSDSRRAKEVSEAIGRAGAHYRRLVERGEFYGDTLDADSWDKEAGVALLSMFLDLYERDGDAGWLEAAREAADFTLTWIWQYDCSFPADSPARLRGFSTTGMTSVSVAHHHLDFYGIAIAYEFLRLHEHTGDRLYHRQALLMLRACRQLVASEDDLLGRSPTEIGWQPEQINHTEWDYFDRPDHRAGHFDIDVAWVTVLGLGAFQRIARRFGDVLVGS